MTDYESTLEKKLSDITESELVTESPEHRHKHDVSRKLQVIERSTGAFVETPPELPAVEDLVAP